MHSTPDAPAPQGEDARLAAALTPFLDGFDLALEGVQLRRRGGRTHLVVTVDLPEDRTGSADLDTVAEASRAISEHLDADPELLALIGPGPSELEVTTPGVDRPLSAPRHFRRARGRLLTLTDQDGRKSTARLLEVTDQDVLVLRPEPRPGAKPGRARRDQEPFELPLDRVATARVEVEFTRPGDTEQDREQDDADDPQDQEG